MSEEKAPINNKFTTAAMVLAILAPIAGMVLEHFKPVTQTRGHSLERHMQSVLATIGIALLLWVGGTLQSLTTDVATLAAQQAANTAKLDDFSTAIRDRFTAGDAIEPCGNVTARPHRSARQ